MTQMPLFPLSLVLFPNAPLPLHIFEDRYQMMIGECIEQNKPFGVVLLREGVAESDEVTFHMLGTAAQIADGVRMEDGRYLINCVGQRRFRVQEIVERAPYFIASVTMLTEEGAELFVEPGNELRALHTRYCEALAAATGVRAEPETLPEDTVDLTYWMAHKLQVEDEQKQHWLEANIATRLREMSAALRAEIALLPNSPGNSFAGGWSGPGSWN